MSLSKRIETLGQATHTFDLAGALEAACQRARARLTQWHADGNAGHPPLEPMAPLRDGATRREREMHEKLTAGRLRVEMARTCPDSVGVRRE
jgi:hypothetical protein